MSFHRCVLAGFLTLTTLAGCSSMQPTTPPLPSANDAPEATAAEEAPAAQAPPAAEPPLDWHLHDAEGPYRGVSVHRAYRELLADKEPRKRVVVAVMDSGVDIEHEDLRPVIWTNDDEVPGNGLDDDGNGYVDDLHGWNFVVDAQNRTVAGDTYEVTRELKRLQSRYADADTAALSEAEQAEYAYYRDVKAAYEARKAQMEQMYAQASGMLASYVQADSVLTAHLGTAPTTEAVTALDTDDEALQQAKAAWLQIDQYGMTKEALQGRLNMVRARVEHAFDLGAGTRPGVYEADSVYYGNHDLYGPDPFHGTHVSGLIGAVRGNGIGMDGVADHVEIMAIRSTPQGDERDRDVANGIRYAVDNGADVINMSFGKTHSGQKPLVDAAVRYAEEHGVLLVHGSGNDGADIDEVNFFPQRFYQDGTEPANWIEVGATSWKADASFAAFFSNYGDRTVDVFAPGRKIYSAQPEDTYTRMDGTSLSAPIVAGVAALVMSYYPELSAEEVREVLLRSVTSYAGEQVRTPRMDGEGVLVDFGTLSSTGGVVNAYEALRLAETYAAR